MSSNSSTFHISQPYIPVFFEGDSYEFWSIKMKTLFKSEGLWDFVETDHAEASDYKVRQKDYQKQDAKALFFIQQAVDKSIFSRIATATSAKQAWSRLKTEYEGSKKVVVGEGGHRLTENRTVNLRQGDVFGASDRQTDGCGGMREAAAEDESKQIFPVANMDVGRGDVDVDTTVNSLIECLKGENQTKQLSPSIYMVPSTLKDHNPSSFKPRMVAIGPLHREDENLQASEAEKTTHMFNLLSRIVGSTHEDTLRACAQKVNASMDKIRACYAETIIYNNTELAKMMVMDGCFILEFLYRIKNPDKFKPGNMMFVQFTMYDLLLLENQIPFLVLEDIFECTISKFDQTASLVDVIHAVLEHVNPFKEHKLTSSSKTTHHHILGLLHECYEYQEAESLEFSNSRFPSAVELDRAGVSFKRLQDTEWPLMMEVKSRRLPCFSNFSWGKPTLIMPVLDINDFTELVLRNLIAYEQFSHNVTQYVTSYAMAMDMLIDTQEDIAKLVQKRVIVNHIGSNQEAADMINCICKEVAWRDFFYYDQWMELNRYYNGYWSKNVAWLRRNYFNNPWNIIALVAGILLFVLTVVQTIFTVNPAGSD
ncbi:hypothetical protein M8C21_010243 [Ambrosia artemisiifolia]|uniref:Uncharacterized protein n=1 Tax=Ambrosia artemisiifolia TaxID=4212 RepID=A0AAD5BTX5_AMBAR|nr:hypothetical protein M8C21_010243 [Ambrosia artemisiifolia]